MISCDYQPTQERQQGAPLAQKGCVGMGIDKSRRCHNCGGTIHNSNVSGYCSRNETCKNLAAPHRVGGKQGIYRPGYMEQYREEKPWIGMYGSAQARAKARGIPFRITTGDIREVYRDVCPVLGIPLKRNKRGSANSDSPTLDRIDSTRGYEIGNIQVLSNKANRMKSDATPEELLQFADWIIRTYGKGRENSR